MCKMVHILRERLKMVYFFHERTVRTILRHTILRHFLYIPNILKLIKGISMVSYKMS